MRREILRLIFVNLPPSRSALFFSSESLEANSMGCVQTRANNGEPSQGNAATDALVEGKPKSPLEFKVVFTGNAGSSL